MLKICCKCGNEIPWYKGTCPWCDGTGTVKRNPFMGSSVYDKNGARHYNPDTY